MIQAFKQYDTDSGGNISAKELEAVQNCLFLFKRIKNGADILDVLNFVYINAKTYRRNEITQRVKYIAAEKHISEGTAYNYLKQAEKIFTRELEII